MTIDDNILSVSKCIFNTPKNWIYVTDEMKRKYFFIFNRYMSKMYPYEAQMLNDKLMDEVTGMNLIYAFLSKKPYPKWFWSKSEKKSDKKSLFSDKELLSLYERYNFKKEEIDFLIEFYSKDIKEELKYIKSLEDITK